MGVQGDPAPSEPPRAGAPTPESDGSPEANSVAPGPRRPTGRSLAITWIVAAAVLGGGIVLEESTRNGMNGAEPILERVGFTYASGFPVTALHGVQEGRRTAVLFVRPEQAGAVCRWAAGDPVEDVTMVMVAPEAVDCPQVALTVDAAGKVAEEFRMRAAKDGGYPMGYAVLDSNGELRYNTLDRHFDKRNFWDRLLYKGKKWEMQTVLKEVS